MPEIIMEIENSQGVVSVEKEGTVYNVKVDDIVKHPNCDADAVIRALGHYLHGTTKKVNLPYSELFDMLEPTSKYEYICASKSYYGLSNFKDGVLEKILEWGSPGWILIDLLSVNGTGNRLFEVYTDGATVDFRKLSKVEFKTLDSDTAERLRYYFISNIDAIATNGVTNKEQLLEVLGIIEDTPTFP